MMTKKQFIALADTIKAHNAIVTRRFRPFTNDQLISLASFLRSQNPRFNRQRWLDYITGTCGPNGGKVKQPTVAKVKPKQHACPLCSFVSGSLKGLVLHDRHWHRTPRTHVTLQERQLSHAEKTRAELDAELADW